MTLDDIGHRIGHLLDREPGEEFSGEVANLLVAMLDHIQRLDAEVRRLRELIRQGPNP